MIDVDPQINNKIVKKQKNNLYATGKRKNSIAKVWLIPNGKGEIKVNKKDLNKYFSRSLFNMIIKQPFEIINNNNFKDSIFPLSGISKILTVDCNENGPYSVYFSDRYGFNNDDRIYNKNEKFFRRMEIIIIWITW